MINYIRRNKDHIPAHIFFIALTVWWIALRATKPADDPAMLAFAATYGLITLYGGVLGIHYSKKWGLLKSTLGKALFFLSLSLFLTELGQLTFSYYNVYAHVDIPYPSLADVGFFGAIPMYILGAYYLSKTLNVKYAFNGAIWKTLLRLLLPVLMVGSTWVIYAHYHQSSDGGWLVKALDYGYPLGQAVTVSIALMTLFNSSKSLGGVMKPYVILLLVAFFLQYAADLNFLIQGLQGSWVNGGYGDYMYLVAYYVMVISLLSFKTISPVRREET